MAEGGEYRRGHADDIGDGREQDQPHDQRGGNAEPARPRAMLGRQLVRQDRDEDQVVDTENDLHRDQRHHRGPALRTGQESEMGGEKFHGTPRVYVRRGLRGPRGKVAASRSTGGAFD